MHGKKYFVFVSVYRDNNTMSTFADDRTILTSNKNPDKATQNLQRALDEITK